MKEYKHVGLTEYEYRVYETLLKWGLMKGTEISKKSEVPHSKTYGALVSLESKGLVHITPIKPKLYRAIPLEEAVKKLKEEQKQRIENAGNAILKSLSGIKKREPEKTFEKVEFHGGYKGQYDTTISLVQAAEKEVVLISKGEKIPVELVREIKKSIKKGVAYKFICYEYSEKNKKDVKFLEEIGLNVKHYSAGEFTIGVRDSEETLLTFKNPKNYEDRFTVKINEPVLSKMLRDYFYILWEKATPV